MAPARRRKNRYSTFGGDGCTKSVGTLQVPVRTVIWLFKKPTFYVVARPDIKSAADLKDKTIGISSFGSDTDLSMKVFAQSGKLGRRKERAEDGAIAAGALSSPAQHRRLKGRSAPRRPAS